MYCAAQDRNDSTESGDSNRPAPRCWQWRQRGADDYAGRHAAWSSQLRPATAAIQHKVGGEAGAEKEDEMCHFTLYSLTPDCFLDITIVSSSATICDCFELLICNVMM